MSDAAERVAAASAEVATARARIAGTVAELQARLTPTRLAGEARETIADAAIAGVRNARGHSGTILAASALIALVTLRRRIAGAFRRRTR